MKNIISQVSDEFPLAVSAIDKYGNAVEINTDRTKKMIAGQKTFNDELKNKAIKETTDSIIQLKGELSKTNREYVIVNGVLKRNIEFMDNIGQVTKHVVDATAEESLAYRDSTNSIQLKIDTQEALLGIISNGRRIVEENTETTEDETEVIKALVISITTLSKERTELIKQRNLTAISDTAAIASLNLEIKTIDEKIKRYKNLQAAEKGFHLRKLEQIGTQKIALQKLEDDSVDDFIAETDRINAAIQRDEDFNQFKIDSAIEGFNALQGIANVFTDNKLKDLDREAKAELAIINDKERQGLLTRDKAEQERRKLDEESSEAKEALEKKAFNRNKVLTIASTITETSLAAIKAYSSQIVVLDPTSIIRAQIAAGVTSALGLAQVATIAAQKFAKGGIIQGASHAGGGVPIMGGTAEVEGGEVILTRGVAQNPSLLAAANSLNIMAGGQSLVGGKNNMQFGGIVSNNLPTFALPQQTGNNDLNAIVDAIADIRIQLDVQEVTSAQGRVNIAESQASI